MSGTAVSANGSVQPSYNPYFSACFFNQNSVFLLKKKQPEQCFNLFFSTNERGQRVWIVVRLG
jgi:hypothetical protein